MKVWITKYALTSGPYECEVETYDDHTNMVSTIGSYALYFHGEGKEWHRTKENAIERCEALRSAKIKSFEKQIEKIKSLDFEGML